ncbi:hypothetical protein KHP11_28320 [Rhodococcus erythropolis]|uniref:LuxR C-terminal-related transcriptional regulator n=1 Tax=Rhodococcus erythropolis TaxID=1833 RepID=UPI0008A39616|nr:LuxR C-terminal-related transcriptional regulator [Rhodococcus erythropolis]MBT1258366.1 hypothetical protein [Rhodococcus erythropolis]OHF24919.1 hypothetical protein BKP30_27410 [Rhodococcus erythropolis]
MEPDVQASAIDVEALRWVANRTTAPGLPDGVVERPRLFRLLDNSLAYPLVTVTGPAGWGKTQLLVSWIRSRHSSLDAAWLSVDRSDTDPRIFWPALMTAISHVRQTISDTEAPVDTIGPVREALVGLAAPLILVIDDVHLLEGTVVESQLASLVHMLPPGIRVFLSGQYLPALPLAKLRVEQKVFAISGKELAFTTSESAEMLMNSGVDVPEQVVAALRDRTEGWSAGLRLAALSLDDGLSPDDLLKQFGGDHIDVADYLMTEVLSHLPTDIEDFLLRTSVCERLTGGLASELSGRQDGMELLKWMARHNVFTTADSPRPIWFRYHPMLSELLQSRLDHLGRETVNHLHTTAMTWLIAHKMPVEAAEHALRAEQWDSATDILVGTWLGMYIDGKLVQLRELIDRLPPEILAESLLGHVRTAIALALGDATPDPEFGWRWDRLPCASGSSRLSHTPSLFPQPIDASETDATLLKSDTLPALSELVLDLERSRLVGDLAGAKSSAQQLINLSRSRDVVNAGEASDLRALALQQLGMTEYWAGRRGDAEAHLREALSEATGSGRTYVQLGCLGHLVLVLTAQNRLTEALAEAATAVALARRNNWEFTAATAPLRHALSWAAYMRGNLDLAVNHLDVAEVEVRRHDAAVRATILLVRGMITGIRGRRRDALELLDEAAQVVARMHTPYVFRDYIVGGQIRSMANIGDLDGALCALAVHPEDAAGSIHLSTVRAEVLADTGDLESAIDLLTRATRTGKGFIDQHVEALVLLAVLRERTSDQNGALSSICAAVSLAAPESFVQPFLQFGRPAEHLLESAARHSHLDRVFVKQVLHAFDTLRPEVSKLSALTDSLDELPTERELEVLRSLDSLDSLPELSASLFISVNTLKAHLRSIYRKLSVSSRREAVAKARSLGLV